MVGHWLVFFTEGPPGWWRWMTRPGFRHVCAMGFDAKRGVWIVVNPERAGLDVICIRDDEEADRYLDHLMRQAGPHVLRVATKRERTVSPAVVSCVGVVKALLGIRCRALAPYALYRHLLATGAEPVENSLVQPAAGRTGTDVVGDPAGRPVDRGSASSRGGTCAEQAPGRAAGATAA